MRYKDCLLKIDMQPKSTTENSRLWRTWHGFNYFFGGGTFLVGSIVLFPSFANYFDAAVVSAWLYTLGSATFLLADITEWLHYTSCPCNFLSLSLNFLVSVIGSLLYLTGSMCYIPEVNQLELGEIQFEIGSAFIVISQTWKIWRTLRQPDKSWKEGIEQDESGFFIDLFAGLGGFMYFAGTFVFQASASNPDLVIPGAAIYSFGGLFFFTSAAFMQKRYFLEGAKEYSRAGSTTAYI